MGTGGCLSGVRGWGFSSGGDGAVLPARMGWGHPLGSGRVRAAPQLDDERGPWVGEQ